MNLEHVVMNYKLPPRELRLLIVLHRLAGADGTTCASQYKLGRLAGVGQAAVGARISRLVKCGLVEKTGWHDGKSRRFKYRLVEPSHTGRPAPDDKPLHAATHHSPVESAT